MAPHIEPPKYIPRSATEHLTRIGDDYFFDASEIVAIVPCIGEQRHGMCEVILRNGLRVIVGGDFTPDQIAKLLQLNRGV